MFKVEYWSDFDQAWQEYIAPTFNARAIRHDSQQEAQDRLKRLQREWPRTRFQVSEA